MKNNYFRPVRATVASLLICVLSTGCSLSEVERLQPGTRYKIICSVYLMAEYDDANEKQLSRETARAYLHPVELANRYFTAFQQEVPVGTIMTIISLAPRIWYLPFAADSYFVRLHPDLSRGLDIELSLDRGLEGSLDGLNPKVFSRVTPD